MDANEEKKCAVCGMTKPLGDFVVYWHCQCLEGVEEDGNELQLYVCGFCLYGTGKCRKCMLGHDFSQEKEDA